MSLQSPAERRLIRELVDRLPGAGARPRLIDLGANVSTVVEEALAAAGLDFVCDRSDVLPCEVASGRPWLGRAFQASIEEMPAVATAAYDAAFANFVLEHVARLDRAAAEIARILKPGGLFVTSAPNPRAPEFRFAALTPRRVHVFVRGEADEDVHHTRYAYRDLGSLRRAFEAAGFECLALRRDANTYGYLHRFPALSLVSRGYDRAVGALGLTGLMGAACFTFRKR